MNATCTITLSHQASYAQCNLGVSYGCYLENGRAMAWVQNCRGFFRCGTKHGTKSIRCGFPPKTPLTRYTCACSGAGKARKSAMKNRRGRKHLDATLRLAEHYRARCGSSRRPWLFLYDLPSSYRVRGPLVRGNDGKKFTFPGYPASNALSLDSTYDMGRVFFDRAMAYPCRVTDPKRAQLFYIPAFNTELSAHPSSFCGESPQASANHHSALYDRLHSAAAGALEARGGIDHLIIMSRPGVWYYESHPLCELNLNDPRLGVAAVASIEQTPPAEERAPLGPFSYHAVPGLITFSIPYPSWIRLGSAVGNGVPWRSRHRRSVAIAAAFSVFGNLPQELTALRWRLRDDCRESFARGCTYFEVRRGQETERSPAALSTAVAELYWNATFCLMPGGDGVTRKATLDALLLGCIPVFFHRGSLEAQYPWHWGEGADDWIWSSSVLFEAREVVDGVTDVVTTLLAISRTRIRRMRHRIAKYAHRVHWALSTHRDERGVALDRSPVQQASLQDSIEDPLQAEPRAKGDAPPRSVGRPGEADSDNARDASRVRATQIGSPQTVDEEDAFTITLQAAYARTMDEALLARGQQKQQTRGRARASELQTFLNVSRAMGGAHGWALEGKCRGSSGAFDEASCAEASQETSRHIPLDKPLPPHAARMGVESITQCVRLCEGCPRCRWASYSLMLQMCSWHHTCEPGVNGSNLDRSSEAFTYRTVRVHAAQDRAAWL